MENLSSLTYADLAQKLYDTCIITDAWIEGKERFKIEPIILSEKTLRSLYSAAERIGNTYQELCQIVWKEPNYLDDYFHLTPYQKFMWLSSGSRWHGIARLDLFILEDGSIKSCEMNSDTPSGESETVLLNQICHPYYSYTENPNKDFPKKFYEMIMALYQSSGKKKDYPSVGIVYPTEMPEDLSMISIYQQWLDQYGCKTVLGSPYNIHLHPSKKLSLFDEEIDIMIRHYKTDWWGERISAWSDVEFPDPDPLDLQLRLMVEAEINNNLTIINPLGAVLTQNKLSMAFCFENISLFSEESQDTIKLFFPKTFRLTEVDTVNIFKDEWVMKSDYGCEGDEVIIGKFVTDEIWNQSISTVVPEHWILQQYFHAKPFKNNLIPNYGVYLLGGEASAIYSRLSDHATDYTATTIPTFIEK